MLHQSPLSKSVIAANVILPFLACVTVLLRVIARGRTKIGLRADDYVIFVVLLIVLCVCVTGVWAGAIGLFGTDFFKMTLEQFFLFQKILRIDALLLYISLGLVKISILLFFQRVFPLPGFKKLCYAVMGVVVAFTITWILLQVFSQKPYDMGWNFPKNYNPITDYRPTFDFTEFLVATASVSMFLDILILLLPIHLISSLHMYTHKRLSLVVIFGTGAFCVVASAVRLYYCVTAYETMHGISSKYTIAQLSVLNDLWGHIEACGSIIAACLPTLSPLFKGSDPNSSRLALFFERVSEKWSCLRRCHSRHTSDSESDNDLSATSSLEFFKPSTKSTFSAVIHALQPPPAAWSREKFGSDAQIIYVQETTRRQDHDIV